MTKKKIHQQSMVFKSNQLNLKNQRSKNEKNINISINNSCLFVQL